MLMNDAKRMLHTVRGSADAKLAEDVITMSRTLRALEDKWATERTSLIANLKLATEAAVGEKARFVALQRRVQLLKGF